MDGVKSKHGVNSMDGLNTDNSDICTLSENELLHALKQSRGFLNYTSRRLNKERKLLDSLIEKFKSEGKTGTALERNTKAVKEAAVMFEYLNLAYEYMIRFAQTVFEKSGSIASAKSLKKKSKVINPDGSPEQSPSIHDIVTGSNE